MNNQPSLDVANVATELVERLAKVQAIVCRANIQASLAPVRFFSFSYSPEKQIATIRDAAEELAELQEMVSAFLTSQAPYPIGVYCHHPPTQTRAVSASRNGITGNPDKTFHLRNDLARNP